MGPIKSYKCSSCSHSFNFRHKRIGEPEKKKCPQCGKRKLFQNFSGPCNVHISVSEEAKVFIQQAERNSKKNKTKIEEDHCKMKEDYYKEKGHSYDDAKEMQEKVSKINKMTEEQKENYLINGD